MKKIPHTIAGCDNIEYECEGCTFCNVPEITIEVRYILGEKYVNASDLINALKLYSYGYCESREIINDIIKLINDANDK
jgi:hypothetical protein